MANSSKTITISIPEGMCADLDRACAVARESHPASEALDVLSEYSMRNESSVGLRSSRTANDGLAILASSGRTLSV